MSVAFGGLFRCLLHCVLRVRVSSSGIVVNWHGFELSIYACLLAYMERADETNLIGGAYDRLREIVLYMLPYILISLE